MSDLCAVDRASVGGSMDVGEKVERGTKYKKCGKMGENGRTLGRTGITGRGRKLRKNKTKNEK